MAQTLANGTSEGFADVEEPLLRRLDDPHVILVEDAAGPIEGQVASRRGATVIQTCFNLINVFMGIGLLSMAYAMRLSGWFGMVALVACTVLFCLSGKLIVKGFQRIPVDQAHTYPALGSQALGSTGKWLVVGFALSEFFGGSCMILIVMWREARLLLPDTGLWGLSAFDKAVVIVLLLTLPLMFVPSLRKLSYLSSMGFVSTLLVTVAVAACVVVDPHRQAIPEQPPPGHDVFKLGIIQAIGIFAVSVSGHSSLPAMRNSMQHPAKFDTVLNMAFGLMLLVYASVSGLGYYYWGRGATELMTTDLKLSSPFSGQSILIPGLTLDKLVGAFIAINAYTTYPLLVIVMQDMVLCVTPWTHKASGWRQPRKLIMLAIRLTIFALTSLVSYLAYEVLGNVMSLVGGVCSMCCSLLLPSLFYALLYRKDLRRWQLAGVLGILLLGACLVVLIVLQNVMDLITRPHTEPTGMALTSHFTTLAAMLQSSQ